MILVFAVVRPGNPTITGITPEKYNHIRSHWNSQGDIVLAGDSRIQTGLSPEHMEELLAGVKVLNCGIPAYGFNANYFDYLERVLKKDSRRKVIVLGVTPLMLTKRAYSQDNSDYLEMKSPGDYLRRQTSGFNPVSWSEIRKILGKSYKSVTLQYHETGWISATNHGDVNLWDKPAFVEMFDNNLFYEKAIEEMLGRVAKWRSHGIMVIALRPPTCKEVFNLENEISGYWEKAVRQRLIEAGAIWYHCDQFAYHSYDNSHLEKEAAIRFSRDMAEFVAGQLE